MRRTEREDQCMQQPTCSVCESKAAKVVTASVDTECSTFDQAIGMAVNRTERVTVRVCLGCARHMVRMLS